MLGQAPMGGFDATERSPASPVSLKMIPRTEPSPPVALVDPNLLTSQQVVHHPDRSRSSGWSRYFTNNEATNLAHMPSQRSTYASSQTRSSSTSHQVTTDHQRAAAAANAELDPPELDTHHVAMGSPTFGAGYKVGQPQRAELAHSDSHESRDPRHTSFLNETSTSDEASNAPAAAERSLWPTSSVYVPAYGAPYPLEPHPGIPSSIYPREPASSMYNKGPNAGSFYNHSVLGEAARNTRNTRSPPAYISSIRQVDENPDGSQTRHIAINSDMSWLKLEANAQHQ